MGQQSCINLSPPWFDSTTLKRHGKMCSYQAEQHLVVFKRVNLDISLTIYCLPQNIAIWVDFIVENYKDHQLESWLWFVCFFVFGRDQRTRTPWLHWTDHTAYLLAAGGDQLKYYYTCSLMGQRGTAFMDATQLLTSRFLQSCSNPPVIFVNV